MAARRVRFLMSEVPLKLQVNLRKSAGLFLLHSAAVYTGTSLIRKHPPRILPQGPRVVLGGWVFSDERGTPASLRTWVQLPQSDHGR